MTETKCYGRENHVNHFICNSSQSLSIFVFYFSILAVVLCFTLHVGTKHYSILKYIISINKYLVHIINTTLLNYRNASCSNVCNTKRNKKRYSSVFGLNFYLFVYSLPVIQYHLLSINYCSCSLIFITMIIHWNLNMMPSYHPISI